MNNVAPILVLIFLTVTFIQSAYDKIFNWKETLLWITNLFSKTLPNNEYIKSKQPAQVAG